jgi:CTP synthase
MDEVRKNKITTYANIPLSNVISAPDAKTIYEIPLMLIKEKLGEKVLKKFNLKKKENEFIYEKQFSLFLILHEK